MKRRSLFKKLLVTFLILFMILFISGNIFQNTATYSGNCQGFYIFGCTTQYAEHTEKTGYGFPFNDLFIHSSHTLNGKTSTTYKTVDWHNVYQNVIVNTIIAAILTLPVFLLYRFVHQLSTKRKISSKK